MILYKLCAFVGESGWAITMHGVNNIKTSNQVQFKSQQQGASKSVCNSKGTVRSTES